jgi:hypothetical protein
MSNTIEVKIDDDELYSAFLRESEGMGLSVEAAVAEAIREWLLVLEEDREGVGVAEERIAEYEATGNAVEIDEVMRERGLKS